MVHNNMIYLIIKERHYDNIDNYIAIEDKTEDINKAQNIVNCLNQINTNKGVKNESFTIVKYETPLLLTEEVA